MTIKIPSSSRGYSHNDWLVSNFSFSFADYYDESRMGVGSLRVLNDDLIAPLSGFPSHPHEAMEIFSYPIKGELTHGDSLGNKTTLREGEVQLMSAGSGIVHSEENALEHQIINFLQIWIRPNVFNTKPSYQQKLLRDLPLVDDGVRLLFSPDGERGSFLIKQHAWLYELSAEEGERKLKKNHPDLSFYFFVIEGEVEIGEHRLLRRDALVMKEESLATIKFLKQSQLLVFEV